MGNSSSEHQAKIVRTENFANDPSAFRVFVKKKNKFIPGWLKINDDEIIFSRGSNHLQFWSLAHLRRYGYTCSGVFFFESGRRCATGEGLHTFQSHQAERIFHMVQSKIKIEEYARGSRSGSVASGRLNSLIPIPSSESRIHPVQRFSSEGSHNEFATPNGSLAPPPYNVFQDTHRAQQNSSPNCPSVISSVSAYAPTGLNLRERPRSIVSNIEHNVIHNMQGMPLPRHPRKNPIQGNTSSSTLLQHMMHQQQNGYALPSHMNSLAASASGSYIMNHSFYSALDSGSPWASQQQLDGDNIIMEHVLRSDDRRRVPRPNGYNIGANAFHTAMHPAAPAATKYFGPNMVRIEGQNPEEQQPHAYVNVVLSNNQQHPPPPGLNVRELHRTDRSRHEFLSTGPGAFQMPPKGAGHPLYFSSSGSAFQQPLMQHSFHQCYSEIPSPNLHPHHQHHQQQVPCKPIPAHKGNVMSQSISGALPPCGKAYDGNNLSQQPMLLTSSSLEQIAPNARMSRSLNYAVIDADKSSVFAAGDNSLRKSQQQQNQINASNSTLVTSSTNTMVTTATAN